MNPIHFNWPNFTAHCFVLGTLIIITILNQVFGIIGYKAERDYQFHPDGDYDAQYEESIFYYRT